MFIFFFFYFFLKNISVIIAPENLSSSEKPKLLKLSESDVFHFSNWAFASEKENKLFKRVIDLVVERINQPIEKIREYGPHVVHALTFNF